MPKGKANDEKKKMLKSAAYNIRKGNKHYAKALDKNGKVENKDEYVKSQKCYNDAKNMIEQSKKRLGLTESIDDLYEQAKQYARE